MPSLVNNHNGDKAGVLWFKKKQNNELARKYVDMQPVEQV